MILFLLGTQKFVRNSDNQKQMDLTKDAFSMDVNITDDKELNIQNIEKYADDNCSEDSPHLIKDLPINEVMTLDIEPNTKDGQESSIIFNN